MSENTRKRYSSEANSETTSFSTKWSLAGWILVLSVSMSADAMNKAVEGLKRVKDGKTVVYHFDSKGIQIYGRIQNRPDFQDNSGVVTSGLDYVEMVDGTMYAITKTGSCYRLEDGIDGFGIYDGKEIIVEQTKEDGSISRYIL